MGLEMLGAVGEAQVQQAVRLAAQSLAQLGERVEEMCIRDSRGRGGRGAHRCQGGQGQCG